MNAIDPKEHKLIVGVMHIEGRPTTVWNGDPRLALRLLVSAAEDIREAIFAQRDKSSIEVVDGSAIPALRNGA